MPSQLRRRAKNKKNKSEPLVSKKTKAQVTEASKNNDESQPEEEETLWQTFTSHPLIKVLPIVLVPYCLYRAYYFFLLQNPQIVSDLLGISLRPSVRVTDERQLLIVGTMSSGTVQVASDLSEKLGLEMGHEACDAQWFFVRDGTVSWFHGTRFLDRPNDFDSICRHYTASMGFHPRMYYKTCSEGQRWSACWERTCGKLLDLEWGCGLTDTCPTPFRTTLHQVRNPLSTVESLTAKFCPALNATAPHASFLRFASAMFGKVEWDTLNCMEAMVTYVVEYNRAMLAAVSAGKIAATYRVEEASPCDIAELAGLTAEFTAVYPSHVPRIVQTCQSELDPARQPMTSTKHRINKGLLQLEWTDLQSDRHNSRLDQQARDAVVLNLRDLMVDLGYDPDKDKEEAE